MFLVLTLSRSSAAQDTVEHLFLETHLLWLLIGQRCDSGQDHFWITAVTILNGRPIATLVSPQCTTHQTDQSWQNTDPILQYLKQYPTVTINISDLPLGIVWTRTVSQPQPMSLLLSSALHTHRSTSEPAYYVQATFPLSLSTVLICSSTSGERSVPWSTN